MVNACTYSVALRVTHMYTRKHACAYSQREVEEAKMDQAKLDEAKLAFEQVWFEHTHTHTCVCVSIYVCVCIHVCMCLSTFLVTRRISSAAQIIPSCKFLYSRT